MRIVFSFSVPEESEAAWLLKKWKREGKVLSHVIQTAIEYGAKERMEIQRDLEHAEKWESRSRNVLKEVFGVHADEFDFFPDEFEDGKNRLIPRQPIGPLITSRKKLKSRSEWTLEKMEGDWK